MPDNCCSSCHQDQYINKCYVGQPGLVDPLAVVQICLPVLNRDVYSNLIPLRGAQMAPGKGSAQSRSDIYCAGIQVYLDQWVQDPEIDRAVQHYIKFPCSMELAGCIMGQPKRALQFLLTYLRIRGPFVCWVIRPGSTGALSRSLTTVLTSHLKQLNDVEFCAATMIGRYLHYLITVGYGHELFYLRKLVGKVWGPVFMKVIFDSASGAENEYSETRKVQYAVDLFIRLLEAAPWSSFTPFEGVDKVLMQDGKSRFIHHDTEVGYYIQEKLQTPKHLEGTMSDILLNQSVEQAEAAAVQAAERTPKPCLPELNNRPKNQQLHREHVHFPPDNCQITYGRLSRPK